MITNLCLDGVLKHNNVKLYIGYDTEDINHSVITMINDTYTDYMQARDILTNLNKLKIECKDITNILLLQNSKLATFNFIETFKFMNNLFIKYKNKIDSLELRIKIKSHTNNKYIDNAGINAPDLNLYLNTKFYINDLDKQKVEKGIFISNPNYKHHNICLNAVPIIELNNEFNNIFKDLDEERFTTGIKPNILNQLKDNIITCYEFEIKEKHIDNLNDTIISTDPNVPKGYMFKDKHISINDKFQRILTHTNPKQITLNDVLYLLKFIEKLL